MTPEEAEQIRSIAGGIYSVDPRLIEGGIHAGKCAVPTDLLTDDRYQAYRGILSQLLTANIAVATAWPVE